MEVNIQINKKEGYDFDNLLLSKEAIYGVVAGRKIEPLTIFPENEIFLHKTFVVQSVISCNQFFRHKKCPKTL